MVGSAGAIRSELQDRLMIMLRYGWRLAILVMTLGALLGSIGLNVALFGLAVSRYRREQEVRLDPIGEAVFGPANEELAKRGRGGKRVVLFGDSRVAMWGPELELGKGVEVVNRGWGGETTAQSLLRVGRDVVELRPDLVVVEVGINDLKGIGLLPERAGEIEQKCGENLEKVVGRIREAGIRVVVLGIFPVGAVPLARRPIWSDETLGAVERVNERLRKLEGPGVSVIDCGGVLAQGGRTRAEFVLDELHLNVEAYRSLNRWIEPKLRKMVEEP